MSEFQYRISQRAERDVQQIFDWLKERSAQGASSWYARFGEVVAEFVRNPRAYPISRESYRLRQPLRDAIIQTRQGRVFRAVFRVEGDEVVLLRVLGADRRPLGSQDLDGP